MTPHYPFLTDWTKTSIRLSDGSFLDLKDPDYTKVPLWCLAEAVCYDFRYVGQGRQKLTVGEHLLKGAELAHTVATVSKRRRAEREGLDGEGLDVYFPFIDPDLARRAFLAHDLQEGAVGDATRALKALVPGIGELEEVHCARLRERLGLPGPDDPVWTLVKWVDKRMTFNEIAQLWEEPVPEAELYYLVGDPELPICFEFWGPWRASDHLMWALQAVGWETGL